MLAANVRDAGSGEALFPGTLVRETGALGWVCGSDVTHHPQHVSAGFAQGLRFREPREVLSAAVERLRDEEACDVVVLVSHLGVSHHLETFLADATSADPDGDGGFPCRSGSALPYDPRLAGDVLTRGR